MDFEDAELGVGDDGLFADDDNGDFDVVAPAEAPDAGAAGEGGAAAAGGPGSAKGKAVDPSQRVTSRYMTKYERARLLGTRALQLRYVVRSSCGKASASHPTCVAPAA